MCYSIATISNQKRGVNNMAKMTERAKRKTKRTKITDELIGGIIIIILAIGLLSSLSDIVNNKKDDTDKYLHNAWVQSKLVVKDNLKSPSSAKFPMYYEGFVKDLGENRYQINAYVDADNSFGTKLRTEFVVYLTLTDNGKGHKDAVCLIN